MRSLWSWVHLIYAAVTLLLRVPILLAVDVCRLGWAALRPLVAPTIGACRLPLMVYTWLHHTSPPEFGQQTAGLDLRCILWTLQTSLDKLVRVSTLKHLVTFTEFADLDPALVVYYFNIFVGCIRVSNHGVAIIPGFEQLTTVSARCFFQIFRHLSATHPTSSVLADLRQRYHQAFPSPPQIQGLPSYHAMTAMADIHASFDYYLGLRNFPWTDYRSPDQGLIPFARHMVDAAREGVHWERKKRVSCWILRFALHSLSLNPPSPTSVIADCLTIIAIALDRDPSDVPDSDEKCVPLVLWVPIVLNKIQ